MTARISKLQAVMLLALGLVFGSLMTFLFFPINHEVEAKPDKDIPVITEPLTVEVTLQKHYIDGGLSEEKVTEVIWAMEDFWSTYADWQLVDQEEGKVIFRKQVDDISPLLKSQGYFGITKDGTLTIFSGKPELDKVIQSFFQIDVEKLEVNEQKQLQRGIPIKTKVQYEHVLETFSRFKVDTVSF